MGRAKDLVAHARKTPDTGRGTVPASPRVRCAMGELKARERSRPASPGPRVHTTRPRRPTAAAAPPPSAPSTASRSPRLAGAPDREALPRRACRAPPRDLRALPAHPTARRLLDERAEHRLAISAPCRRTRPRGTSSASVPSTASRSPRLAGAPDRDALARRACLAPSCSEGRRHVLVRNHDASAAVASTSPRRQRTTDSETRRGRPVRATSGGSPESSPTRS